MEPLAYENWLHDLVNGAGVRDSASESPEDWIRSTLQGHLTEPEASSEIEHEGLPEPSRIPNQP
jgi:hypothetical protein